MFRLSFCSFSSAKHRWCLTGLSSTASATLWYPPAPSAVPMLSVNCSSSSLGMDCIGMQSESGLLISCYSASVFWAMWVICFLPFVWSGSGLNGAGILFCLGNFINTLSPMLRSGMADLSGYSFISTFLLSNLSGCLIKLYLRYCGPEFLSIQQFRWWLPCGAVGCCYYWWDPRGWKLSSLLCQVYLDSWSQPQILFECERQPMELLGM